jgi:hypothetical protein
MNSILEDATLTEEQKAEKIAEVTEYYSGKLKYWTDEANKFL